MCIRDSSLCTRVAASGIMLCAQNAISRPVSRVSPRPLLDRNHWRRSSTNETRQMGTFSAVAQSAVMRSNSWCRGVSSLRGALRLAARAPGGGALRDAGGGQLEASQRRHALVLVLREGPGHLFPASVPPQIYACLASLRGALSQLCRLAGLAGRDRWASRAVKSGAGRKRGTRDTQCD